MLKLDKKLAKRAKNAISHHDDTFSMDEFMPFSQLGESGIIAYLSMLNEQFINKLHQNYQKPAYSLFIPHHHSSEHSVEAHGPSCSSKDENPSTHSDVVTRVTSDVIRGINTFLSHQFSTNPKYVFCCRSLEISLVIDENSRYQGGDEAKTNTDTTFVDLETLLILLDKAQLTYLSLNLPTLDSNQLELLAKALKHVHQTVVCFNGTMPLEQALYLESINNACLQVKVPYDQRELQAEVKHPFANQTDPLSLAQIQAFKEQTILLRPVKRKSSIQNQHHYQQQQTQQHTTEVKIAKSWQLEKNENTQQESEVNFDSLYGDEQNHLLSWQDIDAAFDQGHPLHEISRNKLGEEILGYEFQGGNLIDLWQRMTGDVTLTNQNISRTDFDKSSFPYQSNIIPKQISHKALLTIVRHPNVFQDGVHLASLAETMCFTVNEGALSIYPSSKDKKLTPFVLRLLQMPKASQPSAEHFKILEQSKLPSQIFFQRLCSLLNPHQAWHLWRQGFSALNLFNAQGIEALLSLVMDGMQESRQGVAFVDYVLEALNYYHYHQVANQLDALSERQKLFEYQLQKDRGHAFTQDLPQPILEHCHAALVAIMNRKDLRFEGDSEVRDVLLAALPYHQERLPLDIQHRLADITRVIDHVLVILGNNNAIKLMELALCQDKSVVTRIFSLLQDICKIWGDVGLSDFTHCFITPTLNVASLAEPSCQQAVEQLLDLTTVEYQWWQQLTSQHQQRSGYADFSKQMKAFQFFLAELKRIDLADSLMIPCPLTGINNLQVGLNRVLTILYRSKKPREQLQNLTGLDWRACGVICVSPKLGYYLITEEMQLRPDYDARLLAFVGEYHRVFGSKKAYFHHNINVADTDNYALVRTSFSSVQQSQHLFDFSLSCYYRYLASLNHTAPMAVYRQLLHTLVLPKNYTIVVTETGTFHYKDDGTCEMKPAPDNHLLLLSKFLSILAFATTGKRCLDRLPQDQQQRSNQVSQLILAVFECARARSHLSWVNQLYQESQAVSASELNWILDACASFNPNRFGPSLWDKNYENDFQLDLSELTMVLQVLTRFAVRVNEASIHVSNDSLQRDNKRAKATAAATSSDSSHEGVGPNTLALTSTGQLASVKSQQQKEEDGIVWFSPNHMYCGAMLGSIRSLMKTYHHYFLSALHRIHTHNPHTDLSSFLMVGFTLKHQPFHFDNQGRLLRLMGFVSFEFEFKFSNRPILLLLEQFAQYEKKAGAEALDSLLILLSSIVPTQNVLTLDALIALMTQFLSHEEPVDNQTLIRAHLGDFYIEPGLNEVNDVDFYQSPRELDVEFPGLGQLYSQIKSVVLERFPVSFRDEKTQAWKHFLFMVHQLNNDKLQQQLLDGLIQSTYQNIDLTTLNLWLEPLLKQGKYRYPFHPDYFHALSPALINHPQKKAFIKILDKWLDDNDILTISEFNKILDCYQRLQTLGLSTESNRGFILLLNEIALLENGSLYLDPFYTAAHSHALLAIWDNYPWYDDFIKIIRTGLQQDQSSKTLEPLFASLYLFRSAWLSLKREEYALLRSCFLRWFSNIDQRMDLTLRLVHEQSKDTPPRIASKAKRSRKTNMAPQDDSTSLAWNSNRKLSNPEAFRNLILILIQTSDVDGMRLYEMLIELDNQTLENLASCYRLKPIPSPALVNRLLNKEITVEGFLAEHIRDPHHERSASKLKQQFNDEMLWPYFHKTRYFLTQQPDLENYYQQLSAQLKFVNHIGHEEIRHLPLSEIRQRIHICRELFVNTTDYQSRLTIQLTALSLMREAVYRTSPQDSILWPTAVQTLAILNIINHQIKPNLDGPETDDQINPLFVKMATGEGKTLLSAFEALMGWLACGAVMMVKHQASLAYRDAYAFHPLFDSLGISCKYLTADSYNEGGNRDESKFTGICFLEWNALVLIYQQGMLDLGQNLFEGAFFIIDEADQLILHNHTDNNLTWIEGNHTTHQYAWVFEALAAYLDGVDTSTNKSVRMMDVLDYLYGVYPFALRLSNQLDFISRIAGYLEAVWQAKFLSERIDFISKPLENRDNCYYAAVLLLDKFMPPNVTFSSLVQQGLHGILNHLNKIKQNPAHYPIAPETTLYSTMSPEAAMRWMLRSGRVFALSATLGDHERQELNHLYGFDVIQIPKRTSSSRVEYPDLFCRDETEQLQTIARICRHHIGERTQHNSRAIIVGMETIDQTEGVHRYLKARFPNLEHSVMHAGLEGMSDMTLSTQEKRSGSANHITCMVKGLGRRGFDPHGSAGEIVVIDLDLSSEEERTQFKGRGNRVDPTTGERKKGRYVCVHNLKRYPDLPNNHGDLTLNPEAFKQQQFYRYYLQDASLRLHRQIIGTTRTMIQTHFLTLWASLFEKSKKMKSVVTNASPQASSSSSEPSPSFSNIVPIKRKAVIKAKRDDVLTHFTQALMKISNILPVDDFATNCDEGAQARYAYNQTVLTIYQNALEAIYSVLNERKHIIPDIINALFHEIRQQQDQLLQIHHLLVNRDEKPVLPTIYPKWKKGLPTPAYLKPGKLSSLDYLQQLATQARLPKERKILIEEGKVALEQKLKRKRAQPFNFFDQVNGMINNTLSGHPIMQSLSIFYSQIHPKPNASFNPRLIIKNNREYAEICTVLKSFPDGSVLAFIHDPLQGAAYQVHLTSNNPDVFNTLQTAVYKVVDAFHVTGSLPIRIQSMTQQDSEESHQVLQRVELDFSVKAFDSLNRKAIFLLLANHFNMNLTPLFEAPCLPSLSTMTTILTDIASLEKAPELLKALVQQPTSHLSRRDYYYQVFKAAQHVLKQHYRTLDAELQEITDALLQYDHPFCYQDLSGRPCQTAVPNFESLAQLLENHKKRRALEVLSTKQLRDAPLLLRQQVECFAQLSLSIIQAHREESILSLYNKWLESKVKLAHENISVMDLMGRQHKQTSFFSGGPSLNSQKICEQLQTLVNKPTVSLTKDLPSLIPSAASSSNAA
jgi:hypothetical protein